MSESPPTMEDYLDDDVEHVEPGTEDRHSDDDPYACDHCGKSYPRSDWGVRASKMRRKHERRCPERDADD